MLNGYKVTHDSQYRGYQIKCCHYIPDILCEVNGQFFGFYVSTEKAVNAAQKHINQLIEEKNKKEG